jgi:quinol monooxygenase YgiN
MIHVIATIEVAPGKREAFLEEFRKIVPLVRGETGCLAYGPTIDIATGIAAQVQLRENVVTIVEQWSDLAALQAHLTAPHMAEYRTRVKELVVKVQLQVLEPVS